jgi:GIY-YIG catalytic domain
MRGDNPRHPPFETDELRKGLKKFLDTPFKGREIGNYKFGAYAFFDFDGEPIYCGQTNELIRTRIRRHLTNQRTDAVAMSVLDPFEVFEIEVWPLPVFQTFGKNGKQSETGGWGDAAYALNALEFTVFEKLVA